MSMYTSGWPKNQNRCWYSIGSPPPAGSKNDVLKLRSVNSIVMAPASTGRDSSNKTAVTSIDHTNNGNRLIVIPGTLIFTIVVMKFIALSIDDIPAKCKLNITRSTEGPEWATIPESGGYTVQPVPAPCSTNIDVISNVNAGSSSQKLMLFNRGKAISGAPMANGTNQLPNPPIITGITMKNIMTKACAVTITLYKWSSPNMLPGLDSSNLISRLKAVPVRPATTPNNRYSVPISLWFVL